MYVENPHFILRYYQFPIRKKASRDFHLPSKSATSIFDLAVGLNMTLWNFLANHSRYSFDQCGIYHISPSRTAFTFRWIILCWHVESCNCGAFNDACGRLCYCISIWFYSTLSKLIVFIMSQLECSALFYFFTLLSEDASKRLAASVHHVFICIGVLLSVDIFKCWVMFFFKQTFDVHFDFQWERKLVLLTSAKSYKIEIHSLRCGQYYT